MNATPPPPPPRPDSDSARRANEARSIYVNVWNLFFQPHWPTIAAAARPRHRPMIRLLQGVLRGRGHVEASTRTAVTCIGGSIPEIDY